MLAASKHKYKYFRMRFLSMLAVSLR